MTLWKMVEGGSSDKDLEDNIDKMMEEVNITWWTFTQCCFIVTLTLSLLSITIIIFNPFYQPIKSRGMK